MTQPTIYLTRSTGPYSVGEWFHLTLHPYLNTVRVVRYVYAGPDSQSAIANDVQVPLATVASSLCWGTNGEVSLRAGQYSVPIHPDQANQIREWARDRRALPAHAA